MAEPGLSVQNSGSDQASHWPGVVTRGQGNRHQARTRGVGTALTRAGKTLATCVVALLLTLTFPLFGNAQSQPQTESLSTSIQAANPIDGVPILLDGKPILYIRRGVAGFSAEERAQTITRRLKQFARDDSLSINDLTIQHNEDDNSLYLRAGQDVLLTVTLRDAKASRLTPKALAEQSRQNIKEALTQYRQDRKPGQLARNTIYALLASIAFLAVSFGVIRLSSHLFPPLRRFIASRLPGIQVQNVQIIPPAAISAFWLQVLSFIRLLILAVIFFYYVAFLLRLYPWTRAAGESILGSFYGSVELALSAIGNYLPNLFIVSIIAFIAYYTLRVIKPFFTAIAKENLVIPGFYADWAQPTYNLLMFLVVALAAILAFPYLPGFNSPAFQGVSVFLGLLLSLGSTSAITNVIGGIILIYTRAFRIGDHIRVGDVIGDIIEKNFLAIRICTPANQIITIPNSALLNNNVTNYNLSSRELSRGLILQTTITLGYDISWRKAHATLIDAALSTEHILRQPAPFVLQTKLGNHCISYQLNAYTSNPNLMVIIYSDLHQHIQDKCKQNGIEILSPTYTSLRDGSASTIPDPDGPAEDGTLPTAVASPAPAPDQS